MNVFNNMVWLTIDAGSARTKCVRVDGAPRRACDRVILVIYSCTPWTTPSSIDRLSAHSLGRSFPFFFRRYDKRQPSAVDVRGHLCGRSGQSFGRGWWRRRGN